MNVTNPADCLTISGNVSGIGALTKTGSGLLVLAANNSYGGATTISAGTIELGATASLPNGTSATVNGMLDLSAFGATVSMLTGSGTVNHSGTGSNTLAAGSGAFAGTIENTGGTLALFKLGSGQLMLCGSNTYTGGTTVAAGTLKLDFSQAGAPPANIINNATNTSSLALGGGTLAIQGNAQHDQQPTVQRPGGQSGLFGHRPDGEHVEPVAPEPGKHQPQPGRHGRFHAAQRHAIRHQRHHHHHPEYQTASSAAMRRSAGTDWAVSTGTAGNITAYSAYTGGNLGTLGSGGTPQRLAYRHAEHRRFRRVVQHAEPDRFLGGQR